MQPQAVAQTLVKVEDEWRVEAAKFAECSTENVDGYGCDAAPKQFEKSCSTIVGAVLQASGGDRGVVEEYLSDVCGEPQLDGWRRQLCEDFSGAVARAMTADVYKNREELDAASPCRAFWLGLGERERARARSDREERSARGGREAAARAEAEGRAAAEAAARERRRRAEAGARREALASRRASEEASRAAEDADEEAEEVKRAVEEAQASIDGAAPRGSARNASGAARRAGGGAAAGAPNATGNTTGNASLGPGALHEDGQGAE